MSAAAVSATPGCARVRGGGIVLALSRGNLIEIGVVIVVARPIGMRFALPQV